MTFIQQKTVTFFIVVFSCVFLGGMLDKYMLLTNIGTIKHEKIFFFNSIFFNRKY